MLVIVVIFVILFAGTMVASQLVSLGVTDASGEAVLLDETGEWVDVPGGEGYDPTVYDSLGNAVELTGASDSYVESTPGTDIASSGTWTVSQWAWVDSAAAGDTMTTVSLNGRVILSYDGSASQWSAWYYEESSRDSYRVNVSAPNQPSAWTNIIARSNGTHFTIYRDNTRGETVELAGSSIVAAPVESGNWHGRLDETRTFDRALNDSDRQTLVDGPVGPLPGTDRTARAMYDEADESTQHLFFTGTSLELHNAGFASGLSGSELEGPGNWLGTQDYDWDDDEPQLRPLSGGEIDGAPVAYVDYRKTGPLGTFTDEWSTLIDAATLIPIVLVLGVIVVYLKSARRGGFGGR